MDYSRSGIRAKQRELRSAPKKLNKKLWITVFRLMIIVFVAVCICGVMAVWGAFNGLIDTSPEVALESLEPTGFSSASYYSDGTLAQVFAGAQANRKYVKIDQIPLVVQHCFVALEDERFYEHSGIDVRGIFRAGVSVFNSGGLGFGGSTLTQQLLKNQVFGGGNENSDLDKIKRKVQEQFLAIQLENVLSKDEILEYYVNYCNFGNGAYGIETAAENYFGKKVEELTMSEGATLAPIVLSPTYRNPLTHPEANAERRDACLDKMLELGYCSLEEYYEAKNDDVYTRIAAYNESRTSSSIGVYSYFTDELLEQLYADFEKKLGYTQEQTQNLIYYGGISIYTTQDREIQEIMDKYYTDEANFPEFGFGSSEGSCYELTYALSVYKADGNVVHYQRHHFLNYFADYIDNEGYYYHADGGKKGISELLLSPDDVYAKIDEFRAAKVEEGDTYVESKYLTPQPQSAMTIIDQSTGKVVGVYGGRGVKKGSLTLNRATNTTRSVGSTFKVLASFLPAIDAGGLTLASIQDDAPYFYPNSTKEVINWYTTGFRGVQSIRTGVANSLNVVAVKTLEQIGARLGFEYLKKLGFSTLVESEKAPDGTVYTDVNLALALGGLTNGVTNAELCAAYASIANSGVYKKPIYYTKVLDHDGNLLLSNSTESTQVMKSSTAWLLTSAMLDTTTVGTATRLAFKEYQMPVAGKTGTSSKNNDLWFAGFTPYYTATVWTGYDNNFNQKNKTYQQNLWRNIMETIHSTKELPYAEFEKPGSIESAVICTKCGKLAVSGLCDKAESGDCTRIEYFAKGTVPVTNCTCHTRVVICSKTGKPATQYCPEKYKETRIRMIKDEHYTYPEEIQELITEKYGEGRITTWDTPFVYDPTEICEKHLPEGMVADENGNIVSSYLLEYEKEQAILRGDIIVDEDGNIIGSADDTDEDFVTQAPVVVLPYDTVGESDTYSD